MRSLVLDSEGFLYPTPLIQWKYPKLTPSVGLEKRWSKYFWNYIKLQNETRVREEDSYEWGEQVVQKVAGCQVLGQTAKLSVYEM